MMERSALRSFALGFPRPIPANAASGATIVSLQRGLATIGPGLTTNVTVTAVTLSRAWVLISTRYAPSNYPGPTMVRARLTSTTNLELSRGYDSGSIQVEWIVIEMDGATVQQAEAQITTGYGGDITITAVADVAKTFLVVTAKNNQASASAWDYAFVKAYLTSTTNVRWDRGNNGTATTDVCIFVVELP